MNQRTKELIGWLKLYGERESDLFAKFFFFYMSFDAWITAESSKDRDQDKLKWLFNNENCLKKKWYEVSKSSRMQSLLNNLKNLSPVSDERPSSNNKVELSNIDNFEEVVRFIYQIRCNLFHGSKSPTVHRDTTLVDISGQILQIWVIWAYHKC